MAETIEQMVERLAYEHLNYPSQGFVISGILEFARACMLEQAKRDAAICRQVVTFRAGHRGQFEGYGPTKETRSGESCAAEILKQAQVVL